MDLNHIDVEENKNVFKKIYYNIIIKRAVRNSEFVLTISDYFKHRISEWANVSPNKIINVSCGVDNCFKPLRKSRNTDKHYFLCVSNRKKHKNEFRIIEAFSLARLPGNVELVFSGLCSEELLDLIERLKLGDRVRFEGSLDESDLVGLYQEAVGLVFHSI